MGSNSLKSVGHYLAGYSDALENQDCLAGWRQWIELRFGICHPAWHWTRILLHSYGSDAAALAALPYLFTEFDSERQQGGFQQILANWEGRFGEFTAVVEPASTTTSPEM